MIGLRAAYGQILANLAPWHKSLIAVSADLGRSSGLDKFAEDFPDRYFGVGIAEQNMVGFSAGLAHQQFSVFCSTFAPFAAFRASEQVRMNLGYMKSPVCLVGMASGFALGYLGSSHYGLDDVASIRSIAGIAIYEPGDANELWLTIVQQLENPVPCYLRLTGGSGIRGFESLGEGSAGRWFFEPGRLNVVSAGVLSAVVRQAVSRLREDYGLEVGHFHTWQVRPFSEESLKHLADGSEKILVIQEHSIVGGLGDEIATALRQSGKQDVVRILGIKPGFPHGDSYEQQLHNSNLDENSLVEGIRNEYSNLGN